MLVAGLSFVLKGQDSIPEHNPISIKISPLQALGYRFPVIFDISYGGKFSTEIGVGPTIGRRAFKFAGYSDDSGTSYGNIEKRYVNVHFQLCQKVFLKSNDYSGYYYGAFYRYGNFVTKVRGENTFLTKHHLCGTIGYRDNGVKLVSEGWVAFGGALWQEKFYKSTWSYNYETGENSGESGFEYRTLRLPALFLGINIGLNL